MDDKLKLLIQTLGTERVKMDEKISYHVFSKIGGPAQVFYIATNQQELIDCLDNAWDLKIPFLLIGAGTKAIISSKGVRGLVIKNRTSHIKVGGVKGKVGPKGIGVEEALVEVDSGVSLGKINEFLAGQKLQQILGISSSNATLGGSLFLDPNVLAITQKIRIWTSGEVMDINTNELKRNNQIILSAVLKVKASN